MLDFFTSILGAIVLRFIGQKDTLWAAIGAIVAGLKAAAEKTATLIDDLLVELLEAALANDDIRELIDGIFADLISKTRSGVYRHRGDLAGDAALVQHVQIVAEKLSALGGEDKPRAINWERLLEFFLAVWEKIAPFLLDEDEPAAT